MNFSKITAFVCVVVLGTMTVSAQNRTEKEMKSLAPGMKLMRSEKAFNVYGKKKGGFKIVSKNKNLPAVLGYSEKGSFSDNMPEGLKSLMEFYDELSTVNGQQSTVGGYKAVGPLIGTEWGQDLPYNKLTPIVNGKPTKTGCPATAMAQIMRYYQYPEVGQGQISYVNKIGNVQVSRDLSKDRFDWENMNLTYPKTGNGDESDDAVATLMVDCGAVIQTDYNSESSGVKEDKARNIPKAMIENFNYDKGIRLHKAMLYTPKEWQQMIMDEIQANRPVLYMSSVHAFVLEGCDEEGRFYVNWGWDGEQNGYFYITNLQPEGMGNFHSADAAIITGIQKPQEESEECGYELRVGNCKMQKDFNGFNIRLTDLYNYSFRQFKGYILANLVDSAKNKVCTLAKTGNVEIKETQCNYDSTLYLSFPDKLADGLYEVSLMAVDEKGKETVCHYSQPKFKLLVKDGNIKNVTFPTLVATDIWTEHEDDELMGTTYDVHFRLANTTADTLLNYEVTFVPKDSTLKLQITEWKAKELLPHSEVNGVVSINCDDIDEFSGYLADGAGTPISDYIDLKKDFSPLITIDNSMTLCYYDSVDTENEEIVYPFSTFAENKTNHEIHSAQLQLYVLTDGAYDAKTLPLKIDTLKSGKKRYLKQIVRVPLGKKSMTLWIKDKRGVMLMDSLKFILPEDAKEYQAPILYRELVKTVQTLDQFYHAHEYAGDSLRAGLIIMSHPLISGNPSTEFVWPKTGVGDLKLYDMYGDTILQCSLTKELPIFFTSCGWSDYNQSLPSVTKSILRGGDYVYRSYVDVLGIDKLDTVRVYDDPVVRYDYNNPTIGQDLDMKISANTGYPYADSLKYTMPKMNYVMVYVKPHNGQEEGDTLMNWRVGSQTLNFNLDRYPLLAGTDTLNIYLDNPDIGEYMLFAESDFINHKRRTDFQVSDTVRMDVKLDKTVFRKGVDSLATVHYKADYRWPYVQPEMGDSMPTVRLKAECYMDSISISKEDSIAIDSLYKLQEKKDSLMADSIIRASTKRIYYVNDSLVIEIPRYTFLNVEGDFTFNIDNLPVNIDNTVNFTIRFNGEEQKRTPYTIRVNNPTIDVTDEHINGKETYDGRMYDLNGMEIQKGDVRQHRIIIKNGEKFILN